jgi:predicted nucleotidyltransferase
MSHQTNITRIRAVHNALGDLRDQVVFVGGATVSLYADSRAVEVRPTDDIDVVIELWAYKDYAAIEERLRAKGFQHDQESGVICRYTIHGIVVDVMPTHDAAIGFSNRWYPAGFAHAIGYDIGEGEPIRILSAPYFIASKLEAFKSRGKNDGRTSTDFEDIVFVLENNSRIWEEMAEAPEDVREYLKQSFGQLMQTSTFEEWLDSHVGYGAITATAFLIERLNEFLHSDFHDSI